MVTKVVSECEQREQDLQHHGANAAAVGSDELYKVSPAPARVVGKREFLESFKDAPAQYVSHPAAESGLNIRVGYTVGPC